MIRNKSALFVVILALITARTLYTQTKAPKAYAIAEINVTDPNAYTRYVNAVTPVVEHFGGTYLVRAGTVVPLEGEGPTGRFVIIQFPSLAIAKAFEASPQYLEIAPLRQQASKSRLFLVEGSPTPSSPDADQVWALEKAYWHYVQTDDLNSYRLLWHSDFLGWPYMSPEPLGSDHITDWITSFKNNGDTLKSYDLEQLSIRVTGDIATTTYRIHANWLNKSGAQRTVISRIIHTWLRDASGSWQIISGMSALANAEGH
jgi:uncharacterized protein (DUF1330 family)/ketosteroid isomerase-like protein